ncbi:crotonobetainyl-CoA:carnitine CoA-transferase CaiB-like acyl-CoA transferase [Nitrospirillum amazonense]|uniref:Crotonobetainyl-CoA:carnitine CoA-transferase CaiB-like acyl-CoA transferase n=1 Tax=Nitrospirillum amazonense TaxID=28077 RepID=A0A560F9X2_9PROT|nr:CoA transferase [Nitrospirillum amazonense]TWB18422.1 crotonobetainyl-CoA:carnitine CoA-transferase CaiB-like acyl-CoA transferase [Nitrospirillum amazonense]TWB66057.1 crotonobetainyl-CoA:carnitine CoA-transferase CaiB-like acyl-CoA transferase [Nitrospirillum amazonense]
MPPDDTSPTPAALAGIRVLDLSRVLAGPWAAQILGDLGADVIKIEQPGKGDDTRSWGPPYLPSRDTDADPFSAYYLACNRNKQSVAIDIAKPEGAALVRQLARRSHIVLENFKVGGLARYGLDYASLAAENPGLIYCSITGFGQTGPYAARGGYDFLIQGMSGLMSVTGQPDGMPGAEPLKVGVPVSDLFTGLYATVSILAALRHHERTGEGQHIDCALLDTQVALLANQGMNWLVGGQVPRRLGNGHPNVVPYRCFATRDGHIIVAVGNDGQFRALCQALDRADLAADPRYTANPGRQRHRETLEAALADSIAGWEMAPLIDHLARAGVPAGPINRVDQVFADPQIAARGLVHELAAPDGTSIPVVGFPAKLSRTPARYTLAPPRVGAQTAKVLGRILGLDPQTVDGLASRGVVQSAPETPASQTED